MATAPEAIYEFFNNVQEKIPTAVLGGIVGDIYHSFGYHLARDELPSNDYSVILELDQEGDSGAASALDISLDPNLMITVTNRLLTAARNKSPLMSPVREFCGTTDGINTHPFDLATGIEGPINSWDASHLWHVHISFYRAYSENFDAIKSVIDVITGIQEDTLSAAEVQQINAHTDQAIQALAVLLLYGDGPNVPDARNGHPHNLTRIHKDILLSEYGDGPTVPSSTDTHPNNIKNIMNSLRTIMSRLPSSVPNPPASVSESKDEL